MKDYSRKHYTDYEYRDWMRSYPSKSIWNSVLENNTGLGEFTNERANKTSLQSSIERYLKQSEFKKPYMDKDFIQMEDDWEGPGGFGFNPLDFDYPWSVGPPGSTTTPWTVVFDIIAPDACYCEGATRTFEVRGTHPIYRLDWHGGGVFSVIGGYGTNSVYCKLEVANGENGSGNITGYMTTYNGITGNSNKLVRECRNCDECDTAGDVAFGSGNPETILSDNNYSVSVVGGVGPFIWTASGIGFNMQTYNTGSVRTNTLKVSNTACGSTYFRVQDLTCETDVGVYIRCTDRGVWTRLSQTCSMPGAATEGDAETLISGKYKQYDKKSGGEGCSLPAGCLCVQRDPPDDESGCWYGGQQATYDDCVYGLPTTCEEYDGSTQGSAHCCEKADGVCRVLLSGRYEDPDPLISHIGYFEWECP